MGTRADFYIGRGKDAEWLGSIAYDGYEDGHPQPLLVARTEQDFRDMVEWIAESCDHFTAIERGWPWPWEDSGTTDYAYAYDDGIVWVSSFGHSWRRAEDIWRHAAEQEAFNALTKDANEEQSERWLAYCDAELWDDAEVEFPDMTARQNVTLGKRSGVLLIGK